jgi:hypothetical protein
LRSGKIDDNPWNTLYREAKAKIAQLLGFADPPAPEGDPDPGDPAGNGGSPAH